MQALDMFAEDRRAADTVALDMALAGTLAVDKVAHSMVVVGTFEGENAAVGRPAGVVDDSLAGKKRGHGETGSVDVVFPGRRLVR